MTTTGRPQQRCDHRLRELVQRKGDVTLATDLGVPRSTARGWLGQARTVLLSLDVTDLRASELQQGVSRLRGRVKKLTALLRLALALRRTSGFTFGWRRPRVRVHPAKPKVGLRTTRPNDLWHIDTTVIRLLDGTRA